MLQAGVKIVIITIVKIITFITKTCTHETSYIILYNKLYTLELQISESTSTTVTS